MDTTKFHQWQLRRIGCPATCPLVLDIFPLKEGTVTFGRNQKNDYFLDSRRLKNFISRTHAEITGYHGDSGLEYKIREQGLNGTFINDIRIQGCRVLTDGDKITFGHTNGYKIKPGEYSVQHNSEFEFVFERVSTKLCPQQTVQGHNGHIECSDRTCDCTSKDCLHGKMKFTDSLKIIKPHLTQETTISYAGASPVQEFVKPSMRAEISKHGSVSEFSKHSPKSEFSKCSPKSEFSKQYSGSEFSKFSSGFEFLKNSPDPEFSKQNCTKNSPVSKYQSESRHSVEKTYEEHNSSDSDAECIMEVCLEDSSEQDAEVEAIHNGKRDSFRHESGGSTSYDSVDGYHSDNRMGSADFELRDTTQRQASTKCDINDNLTAKDESLHETMEAVTDTFQRQSSYDSVQEGLSEKSSKKAMLQDIQNLDPVKGRSRSVPVSRSSDPILSHNSSTIEKDLTDTAETRAKKNQSNAKLQPNKRKKGQPRTRRKRKRNQLSDSETDELEDGVEWYDTDTCAAADCARPKAKRVAWVQCDDCDQWYHTVCVDCSYEKVKDSKMQFYCGCQSHCGYMPKLVSK